MPAATTVVGRRVVGKSGRAARMRNNVCHPVIKSCSARPSDAGATEMSLPESAPCPPCPSSAPTCRASSRAVATCPRPSSSMAKSPAACWAGCNTSGWRRRPCWTRAVARATTCRCCVSAIRTRPTPAWTTASRCWPPRASATRRAGWAPGSASWRAVARPRPPSSMATWRRPAWRRNRWSWSGPTWPCTGTARRTRRWPNGGAC